MEIKDLRIFKSVAQHNSISKAANELNFVQSHVTTRIKLLESHLNTQLFHRHSRGTTLNAEGKKLLAYTENVLWLIDEMEKAFQDSECPTGSLEIGTVETVLKLPGILSAYHKNYPNVDLSLVTGVSKDLIDQTLKRDLDGAFVTGFGTHPDIEQIEVFKETLVLISAKDATSLEKLKKKPILVFNAGCSYRARLEKWLEDEGIHQAKIMEFGTLETILGSVISGLGISLVPYSTVVHLENEGIINYHTLPESYSNITTVFIRRKDTYLTNTIKKFLETINNYSNTEFTPLTQPIFNMTENLS